MVNPYPGLAASRGASRAGGASGGSLLDSLLEATPARPRAGLADRIAEETERRARADFNRILGETERRGRGPRRSRADNAQAAARAAGRGVRGAGRFVRGGLPGAARAVAGALFDELFPSSSPTPGDPTSGLWTGNTSQSMGIPGTAFPGARRVPGGSGSTLFPGFQLVNACPDLELGRPYVIRGVNQVPSCSLVFEQYSQAEHRQTLNSYVVHTLGGQTRVTFMYQQGYLYTPELVNDHRDLDYQRWRDTGWAAGSTQAERFNRFRRATKVVPGRRWIMAFQPQKRPNEAPAERGPGAPPRVRPDRVTQVVTRPGTAPKLERFDEPPTRHLFGRSRERKVYTWHPWVVTLINSVTETNDFVEGLWEALPPECQRGRGLAAKVADIARCWEEMDVEQAVLNVVLNALEDAIVGRLSGAVTRGQRNLPVGTGRDRSPSLASRLGQA